MDLPRWGGQTTMEADNPLYVGVVTGSFQHARAAKAVADGGNTPGIDLILCYEFIETGPDPGTQQRVVVLVIANVCS